MTPEQEMYAQALAAFKANDLVKARELFSQLLKLDRKNINYWLWMSAAVETTKERIYCLREILVLDPNNEEAALGLRMLNEKAPDAPVSEPSQPLSIPWKTHIEIEDESPQGARGLRSRLAIYSFVGALVVVVFAYGIYLAFKPKSQLNTSEIMRWTITPAPSDTITSIPTMTSTGPAALSIALDATFTPTAIYVATPHNRLEAYSTGMRAYEKQDWAKAIDYFQQVLDVEPNDADVYYHMGDAYRFEGDYANALKAYQNAVKIDPNFAPGYLGEAQVYLYGSPVKTDEAFTALQKAVSLDPNLSEANIEIANVYLAQNDPDTALAYLDDLDPSVTSSARVELIRAKAYQAKGDYDKALASIDNARKYDRSALEIYLVWAQILQAQGNYDASLTPLLTYKENASGSLSAQIMLAKAYYYQGNDEKAMTLIDQCLQQDDKMTDAYILRGNIYLDQGKIEDARSDFNAVLRYEIGNFDANIGIGRVLLAKTLAGSAYNQFDYTEDYAKTEAQKAILMYWRATSLKDLDMTSAAIRDYQAALDTPLGVLPDALRADAETQLNSLYTPTPSLTPTDTSRPTKTFTVTPTPNKKATATPKPSATPTKK